MSKFFEFVVHQKTDIDPVMGEIKMSDNNYCVMKWFYPRVVENGISFSDNEERFCLERFERFMNNIRNGINCSYVRDNEEIFIYCNNKFKINPDTCQTGLNFDSSMVDFKIDVSNPLIKSDLLNTLQSIYDWAQSLMIENVLIENNL
jgi:hypothetical protein